MDKLAKDHGLLGYDGTLPTYHLCYVEFLCFLSNELIRLPWGNYLGVQEDDTLMLGTVVGIIPSVRHLYGSRWNQHCTGCWSSC